MLPGPDLVPVSGPPDVSHTHPMACTAVPPRFLPLRYPPLEDRDRLPLPKSSALEETLLSLYSYYVHFPLPNSKFVWITVSYLHAVYYQGKSLSYTHLWSINICKGHFLIRLREDAKQSGSMST